MSNSVKASSIVQTPRSATVVLGRTAPAVDAMSVMSGSRRESYCCTERSLNGSTTAAAAAAAARSVVQSAASRASQWASYRSDITSVSRRTPITEGKFRTDFSYRKAEVPEGYPKSDHQRNPRRESIVGEFSRKVFEGYDIWEDEDRPVINWKFPQMPIRSNKTHELRKFANLQRIQQMVEREKQMNKRNSRFAAPTNKKETAWWEKTKNGVKGTQMTTPRYVGGGGSANSSIMQQNRAAWTSNVSSRSSNYITSRSPFVAPRRK